MTKDMLVTACVLTYRHNCWSVADELFLHFWPNDDSLDGDDDEESSLKMVNKEKMKSLKKMTMIWKKVSVCQ